MKGYLGASPGSYEVVDFASDTASHSTLSGSYSSGSNFAAFSSNNNFGYIGGGNPGGTTVYRFDYLVIHLQTSKAPPLSVARYWFCGNGNQNYGYMNSGVTTWNTDYTTVVDRIDYGNDIAMASLKGPLNVTNVYEAGLNTATGNADYSYVLGDLTELG